MAKKGFPKDLPPIDDEGSGSSPDFSKLDPGLDSGGGIKSKGRVFLDRIFSCIKFILGLMLLTLVYAGARSFLKESYDLERVIRLNFWYGAAAFLGIYLFVFEPANVYQRGQKIMAWIFKFIAPLVKVAPFVLPIYTLLLLLLYPLIRLINATRQMDIVFVFLLGFTMALHLVFSAKTLRSRQGDFLKANYIFGFSMVFILDLMMLAGGLNLIYGSFSFLDFFTGMTGTAHSIYTAVIAQVLALK